MRLPAPPSTRPLSGHRSHFKSTTAGTLLRLFSLFPAGLPFQYGAAPRPFSDPSPPPAAETGRMSAVGAAPAAEAVIGGVGGASGVQKEGSLLDGKIGRVAEGKEPGPAGVRKKGSLSDEKIGRVVKGRKRVVSIEVGLDSTVLTDLFTGEVNVECVNLDEDQGNGENFSDSLMGGSAMEGDWMVEENVVDVNPGAVIDSDKHVEPCKLVEAAGCKNADALKDEEVEEGEIPGEVGLPMFLSDEDTAGDHGIDEKEAHCSAKKEFAPDVQLSNIKFNSNSGEFRSKVDYGGLSELTDVVRMNPEYGRSFMSKDNQMKSTRKAPCSQLPFREKTMVKNSDIASSKEGDGVCVMKKKQGSISERKKAKKKIAKKRKRAEQNKKLGVKRLKLAPVSKPKEVKICKHYLNGRCQLGDKCKFSHDAVPLTKSQPCKYFARNSCLRVDDCPYDHELSKYPCDNYVSRGSCVRGDSCLFSHKVELSQDPSNARDAKSLLVAERGNFQGNSSSPLVSNTLFRTGSAPSMTSILRKSSLPEQRNDLNSVQKLDLYTMKTPPEGITFLSFGTDTTTSNKVTDSPKKDIENNSIFTILSDDKMPSRALSLHSPSRNHKMAIPSETNNSASSSRENHSNDIIAPSLGPKMQSDHMDASQLLDLFLFNNNCT